MLSRINRFSFAKAFHTFNRNFKKINRPVKREVMVAEHKAKIVNSVYETLTKTLKHRNALSASEWKEFVINLNSNDLVRYHREEERNKIIFTIIKMLRPPNDSMENAKNFITAMNLKEDLGVNRNLVELYSKKSSEAGLTDDEQTKVLKM